MALIVQKYGGSSLASPDAIRNVAAHIAATRAQSNDLVVVVSAMGKTTDELLQFAMSLTQAPGSTRPSERELALLLTAGEQISAAVVALALSEQGTPAVALTGPQAGIETTDCYRDARVIAVHTQRLEEELAAGRIPVVAGFQGATKSGEMTTLGRGGSDTTAAALAAALGADACEICTDVAGVFTADPRLVPQARLLDEISYDEMFEMASTHGGVVHPRAVHFARTHGFPIHVRHSGEQRGGTIILRDDALKHAPSITGVALRPDVARLTLTDLPNRTGVLAGLLHALATQEISVEDVTSAPAGGGGMNAAIIIDEALAAEALRPAKAIAGQLGATCAVEANLALVTLVGRGLRTQPRTLSRLLDVLAEAQINVHGIGMSEVRASVLIERGQGTSAVQAVHSAFGLERGAAVA